MLRRILAAALLYGVPALAADDVVLKAMRDELARSMKKLQLETLQKPYFIAYRSVDMANCVVNASFGALVLSACEPPSGAGFRSRSMNVEVRVGDYVRDNTNFFSPLGLGGVLRLNNGLVPVPLEDNYDELRRQLWLATDSAYKNALDIYAKKKAALENRTRTDDAPDFSNEQPFTFEDSAPAANWNPAEAEALVKTLSAVFREAPGIDNSQVRLTANTWFTRYVNSEGTSFLRGATFASLAIGADTQAVDGIPLSDVEVMHARSFHDLPPRDEILKRIRALESRLENLRKAPLLERYTGPVLFEGQAAGELMMQSLGSALVGVPRVVVDDLRFERAFNANGGFADKIGARVLPDFMSVTDEPAARERQGTPLFGGYPVDDDGVKAGRTLLVDKGILKTLLHSRALIPDTTQSTGNHRGTGVMPSNLFFTTDKRLPAEELKAELLRRAKQRGKEYGVVVRRMGNPTLALTLGRTRTIIATGGSGPGSIDVEPLVEAYKVFPDGHEELVRNLSVNGLTLGAFKDILAVSDIPSTYTAPVRVIIRAPVMATGFLAPGGPDVVSVTVPSLLFEDMALQRPTGDIPNLPVTKHPYFEKAK